MIGFFDSGSGGLTILKAWVERSPRYSFTYLSDSRSFPYGNRTEAEIRERTRLGVEYLFSRGCNLVVLACNTASACALRYIQQEILLKRFPEQRVLGMIAPTVEQITSRPWNGSPSAAGTSSLLTRVGVLATKRTVASGAFVREIQKRAPAIQVFQHACTKLADALEVQAPDEEAHHIFRHCFQKLMAEADQNLDALLLGCTHYAFMTEWIRAEVPSTVLLLEQPAVVAQSLAKYLQRHEQMTKNLDTHSRYILLSTGDTQRLEKRAKTLLPKQSLIIEPTVHIG